MSEPIDADWLHLADDESVVWHSRPHPIAIGWRLPLGFFLLVVGLGLLAITATNGNQLVIAAGFVFGTVGLGVLLVGYILWTNTRYVLTSSQLYLKRGIISRDVTQFRLDRIQNTTLEQGYLGRVLGYGELTVYTAGSSDPELAFEWVPRPERAARRLSNQLDGTDAEAM